VIFSEEMMARIADAVAARLDARMRRPERVRALAREVAAVLAQDADAAGWVSVSQAAVAFGVSTRAVRGWIAAGKVAAKRRGGRWMVQFDEKEGAR
jgi:hypothetical protein